MRESLKEFKRKYKDNPVYALESGVCAGKNAKKIYDNLNITRLYLIDWYNSEYSDEVSGWLQSTHKAFDGKREVSLIIGETIATLNSISFPRKIDYIYIDDTHSPEHVFKEMEILYPVVAKGGMLAGHDYVEGNGRAEKAVKDFCVKYKLKYQYKKNASEDVCDWWIWKA